MPETEPAVRYRPGVVLSALLEAAVDAIFLIDDEGTILLSSKSATSLLGFEADDLRGENIKIVMPGSEARHHDDYIQRYLELGEPRIIGIGRDVTARHRDGSLIPVHLSVGEARLGDRRLFVGILRDRTREVEAEREARDHRDRLAHVDRLNTLGAMAAALAHEVNQPLGAIGNYAEAGQQILRSLSGDADARLPEVLGKIAAQADRAGRVVHQLRTLARPQSSERRLADLRALIVATLELTRVDSRFGAVEITQDVPRNLPLVLIDPIQIQQVLLNLLRNAAEAQEAETALPAEIGILVRRRDGEIEVRVRDRGPGVSEEMASRLMEPFRTSKAEGMGLGLAICQSIVSAHGGRLWFENNDPPPGVTFLFTLPL